MIFNLSYSSNTTKMSKHIDVKVKTAKELDAILHFRDTDSSSNSVNEYEILLMQSIVVAISKDSLSLLINKIQDLDSVTEKINLEMFFDDPHHVRLLTNDYSKYSFYVGLEDKDFNVKYIDMFYSRQPDGVVMTIKSPVNVYNSYDTDSLTLTLTLEDKYELDAVVEYLKEKTNVPLS